MIGVEATGLNACPCAQGLVRERAAERLGEAGFADVDVERILELVPLATHNQRGRGLLYLGTKLRIDAEELVSLVERSMSSPIYELLKRPDELFVVEHAHLTPRFVEDSVRLMVKSALEGYPELADDDSSWRARSTSRRSTTTRCSRSATARSARSAPSSRTARTRRATRSCASGSRPRRRRRRGGGVG